MDDPLYKEIILEHWENPQNYGVIKSPDFDETNFNPTCGDEIRFTGKIKKGKLIDIKFTSKGCAISKASASLLTQKIINMKIEDILKLKEETVLSNLPVKISPARHNCALLGIRCINKGIEKN
jgi:nitrogen fixation protein NifU and related proteins